jgi:carboxyl-terminal processing protease
VRLQVLPAGVMPGSGDKVVTLVRDKVKLEAQAAKRKLIEVGRNGETRRIGVIEVPSFYQDYNARASGAKDYVSTTADVRRLTQELEAEGVDGLVIDLRNNGGGHLSEATAMTGLFIDRGPVVQLRDTNGRIEVLEDPMPEVVYDGPMAVLVNRFSASASEIFAAAIQDYGRGVVIGQQTYGKGTVQNLYPLDRYAPGPEPNFGQLTLTIGKYYRVTGESTQHRGVMPDIALPSPVDAHLVGESTRDTALPWDQIRATRFRPEYSLGQAIEVLSGFHDRRASADPDLGYLVSDIEAQEALRNQEFVSLKLEQRQAENTAFEARRLALENERRAAHGLEPLASLEALSEEEAPDIVLREAAEIVTDIVSSGNEILAIVRSESDST